MSTFQFDLQDLQRVVNDAASKGGAKMNKEDYTKTSYLPEGTHTVAFFFDPNKKLFRDVAYHKPFGSKIKSLSPDRLNYENKNNPEWAAFVQGLCPEYAEKKLTQLPPCEIAAAMKEAQQIDEEKYGDAKKGKSWKLKLGVNYNTLIYMSLYETTNKSEYWTPNEENGTPYAVIGTKKLKDTFLKMLETYGKNPAAGQIVVKALNPNLASVPFTIVHTRGVQGSVNISQIPGDEKPAIVSPSKPNPVWWRPLNEVFVKPEFNLDDYRHNVKIAQDLVKAYRQEQLGSSSNSNGGQGDLPFPGKVSEEVITPKADPLPNLIEIPIQLTSSIGTPEPESTEDNQKLTKMGNVITLPDFAVKAGCWGNFKPDEMICNKCPVNLECTFEQD